MGEIKFKKKTLVEAINTTLQEMNKQRLNKAYPPLVPGFMSAGMKAEAPQHWGNYRFLPSFWKFLGYSPAGWMDVQWITPVPTHPR